MMWGKIGAVLVALLLCVGVVSAGSEHITIDSPSEGTNFTNPEADPKIDVSTGMDQLINVSLSTADYYHDDGFDDNDTRFEDHAELPDGEHMLTVFAQDNDTLTSKTRNFTVDTTGPEVTDVSPDGTTFDRYPVLEIQYEDAVSTVEHDSVEVWLNGTEVSDNGTATATNFTLDLADIDIDEGTYAASVRQLEDVHGNDRCMLDEATEERDDQCEWTFTIPQSPVLTSTEPTGLHDEDVTIGLRAEDPLGIDRDASELSVETDGDTVETVSFDDADDLENTSHGVDVSHAVEDLDDGHYTIEASVTDIDGNTQEEDWEFTVDTTPPEMELQSHSDEDIVKDVQAFTVEATDELSDVEQVGVELDDELEITTSSSNDRFHIDIDTTDVSDGEQDIVVFADDENDNRNTLNRTLVIDNTPPGIHHLDVYPETVTSVTEITATVEDDATGVESVTYQVRNTDVKGTLLPKDGILNSGSTDVAATMDAHNLSDGNYTLMIEATDGAGNTRSAVEDITVDSDREYELELRDIEPVLLTAGEETTVDIGVRNRGDADDLVALDTDADIVDSIEPDERRARPGETRTFDMMLAADTDEPGPQNVTVTASGFTTETTAVVPVTVQPTPEEQDALWSELQQLEDRYTELEEEREDYMDAVDDDAAAEFEETDALLDHIADLMDNGEYYTAAAKLEDADGKLEETDTAVTGMASTYQRQQLTSIILRFIVFLTLAGGVVAFYLMRPPEEGYRSDDGFVYNEDDRHPFQRKADELRQQVQETAQQIADGGPLHQQIQGQIEQFLSSQLEPGQDQETDTGARADAWDGFN